MFSYEYTLPVLHIHAGETTYEQLDIQDVGGDSAISSSSTMECKVFEYCNRESAVLTMPDNITYDDQTKICSVVLAFNGSATKEFYGKYIYQLEIYTDGDAVLSRKGIVYFAFNAIGGESE